MTRGDNGTVIVPLSSLDYVHSKCDVVFFFMLGARKLKHQ